MGNNIIFILISCVILLSLITTIQEGFNPRRQIRRKFTKPIKQHINNHIDAFKHKMTDFQNRYL